ncbi:hypothetical protein FA95DRAFT_1674363 [Auriscalpium vulgare]|uniref:Uncharacterized protein n=1 Tax=Auriscalpium vulgare TaxID=40419 RepID=A0ACB8SBY6_9AGAM|nr:hypothetical protein FA95DRAFT_1674363 [Auriscalpium vulgare]
MANVVYPQPQIDFHPSSATHTSSPFGFNFGLAMSSPVVGWSPSGAHGVFSHPAAIQQLASTMSQPPTRSLKRRVEDDDQSGPSRQGSRDDAMDRSPTPERPKRTIPKRARTTPATPGFKEGGTSKENQLREPDDQDVDVGVLLATLPPQSLLPLLTSLIQSQPSLKPLLLSLIPRPSLDTAIQALNQSAKKLRDAYPYSNTPQHAQASSSSPFGFGFASGFNSRPSAFGTSPLGFGRLASPQPSGFGATSGPEGHAGMREEYIVSRVRPHINEFVSASTSYLRYFSCIPPPSASRPGSQPASSSQPQAKDKPSASETFIFLQTLTSHVLAQPALTQASLAPLILPRLLDEWRAWIGHVDDVVNKQGGMFGGETVRTWERDLDGYAEAKGHGLEALRDIRDQWVGKVGWLVGRMLQPMMMDA